MKRNSDLGGSAPDAVAVDYNYLAGSGRVDRMDITQGAGSSGVSAFSEVDALGRATAVTYLNRDGDPLLRLEYEYGGMDWSSAIHLDGEYPYFISEMREYRATTDPLVEPGSSTITPTVSGVQKTFALFRQRLFTYDSLGRLANEIRKDGTGTELREWDFQLDIVNNLESVSLDDHSTTITMDTATGSHNQLTTATLAGVVPMLSLPVEGTFDVDENVNIVSARVTVKNGANVLWQGDATVECCAATGTDYRETGSYAVVAQFTPPASNATLTVQVEVEALRDAQDPSGYETVSTTQVDYMADADTLYYYDDRLNLIKKVVGDYPSGTYLEWNYEYDALNRMTAAELPSNERKVWTYDAQTRRLGGSEGNHIYGPGWETIADVDNSLNPTTVYIMGGGMDGQLGFVKKEGTEWSTYYYLRDHLGSVLALVDETGAIVESYEYEPYGLPTFYDSTGSLIADSFIGNRMLYTGREWNADLEMYHYRHRTYDPRSKRFMQGDPIGLGGGWNYYAYVGGNPVMVNDPAGLVPKLGPGKFLGYLGIAYYFGKMGSDAINRCSNAQLSAGMAIQMKPVSCWEVARHYCQAKGTPTVACRQQAYMKCSQQNGLMPAVKPGAGGAGTTCPSGGFDPNNYNDTDPTIILDWVNDVAGKADATRPGQMEGLDEDITGVWKGDKWRDAMKQAPDVWDSGITPEEMEGAVRDLMDAAKRGDIDEAIRILEKYGDPDKIKKHFDDIQGIIGVKPF